MVSHMCIIIVELLIIYSNIYFHTFSWFKTIFPLFYITDYATLQFC